MAVRKQNVLNSRKAVMWDERDDAQLAILLKRKIKDTSIALRESETPYERSKLKSQRLRYKSMLNKVEKGAYNGDIIFNELRASAALRQEQEFASGLHSSIAGGKAYTNSYGNMDFDYEAAFRKKRYYGMALPIFMTIVSLLMIAVMVIGIFCPTKALNFSTSQQIENTTGGMLNINALMAYRVSYDNEASKPYVFDDGKLLVYFNSDESIDIAIKPDEEGYWKWPDANYPVAPTQGSPYEDEEGVYNDPIYIKDGLRLSTLGVTKIYIDAADLLKAWFKTKMLEKTRIDILEDQALLSGTSIFYACFLSNGKADELVIKKNDEGNYDFGVIYNHIGVYGTIMFLLITIVLCVVLFIENFVRIFTYTSRRVHVTTILTFISSLFAFLCPAFATCEGTEIGAAFTKYFAGLSNPNWANRGSESTIGASFFLLLPLILSLILTILPLLFKNRYRNLPTHIPKGNRKAKMFV